MLVYHEWATPRLGLSGQEFVDAVLASLEVVEPGIADVVEFAYVTRWTPGALKSTRGTHQHPMPRPGGHLARTYELFEEVRASAEPVSSGSSRRMAEPYRVDAHFKVYMKPGDGF